jgi:CheY-like chemotaxis protein
VFQFPQVRAQVEISIFAKVVLVDDDPEILQILRERLKPLDVSVTDFASPELAREFLTAKKTSNFTLITDLVFHGADLNGFDVLESTDEKYCQRIMLTSLAESSDVQQLCTRSRASLIGKADLKRLVFTLQKSSS